MSFSVPSTPDTTKDEAPPSEDPTALQDAQVVLNYEDVTDTIRKSILFGIPEDEVYSQEKLNKWCTNITEECIQRLTDLKKPFKYVVFCDVGQNIGNAMHHSITTYWDRLKDKVVSLAWCNTTIFVVVTVLGACTEAPHDPTV